MMKAQEHTPRGNVAETVAPTHARAFCTSALVVLMLITVAVTRPAPADGSALTDQFSNPQFAGLELEPLGPALANTVASIYPVASASSSVTYVYNPALETFERQTRVLGPIIGERAETVGKGQMNVALSFSYVKVSGINGQSLGHLVNQPLIDGNFVFFSVPGGTRLADGRLTTILPVLVNLDIDAQAYITSPSVTYGITTDWDVNLTLPLLQTSLGITATATVPDPRLPQFALPMGSPLQQTETLESSDSSFGVGDLLLRTKYVLLRETPFDLAAFLGVSFPTGSDGDLHGTGTFRVRPTLVLSRVFADRVEPLVNVGVDIDADDVDRSVFQWAAGATARVYGPLTAVAVFLGATQFNPPADAIQQPFFFQIERADIFDVSLGLRLLFADSGVISAGALVPLNNSGLRADVIPTVEVEYAFTTPW
jgi:outer membrane putative beta-barrel porin/alpha-amylase